MSKIVHNKMKNGRFCIVFLFLAIIFIPIFLGALNSIETKNLLLKFSVKKSDSEISKNITLRSETGGLVGVAVKGFEKEGFSVKQPEIIFDKEGEKIISGCFTETPSFSNPLTATPTKPPVSLLRVIFLDISESLFFTENFKRRFFVSMEFNAPRKIGIKIIARNKKTMQNLPFFILL